MSQQRLPPFDPAQASAEQQAVLAEILSGPRGNLNGPFLGWIYSPEFAQQAQRLGAFCRYRTGLPTQLSELAILVIAARWRSQAEWFIHLPIALKAGIPAQITEAIRVGQTPEFDDPDQALIYRFATELETHKRVRDTTYASVIERFGLQVAINLVGLLGYYTLVAMTLNTFEMRAEGQTTLPFDEK